MLHYAGLLLQWSRAIVQRLFLQFGLHCATHQIRIILVSCVVITSLFYPALAIYTSSHPKSLSILDSFVSPSTVSGFGAPGDLINLWSHHGTLRIHEDAVTRAKCGVGRALRVERLLVQGPMNEDVGALSRQTLLSTLDLENRLEKKLRDGKTPCLRRPNGNCFVLSPLLFWNHDREKLLSDANALETISASTNVSIGSIFVTPQMVLAGRGSHEPQVAGSKFDFAEFLAVTYFFPESDCLGSSEHASWLKSVQSALFQEPEFIVQTPEPTLIALEHDPNSSRSEAWSALSTFLYPAYVGFIGYVVWSVGNMTAVHSRLGVTFTALVEIAVSTITSLSVCALVGFKITMVPWEVLPIVIVFVGAENMFNLVDAVCKTPVTLSVKQRIAEGLSRAGTSNTTKVVSYNTILGIIAFFSVGAVRQFCSFAIVVLVAHWFLAHTFFLAVLSIDLQRLELEELLRHDPSILSSPRHQGSKDDASKKPGSVGQRLVFTTQSLLKARATTNLSLLMLLAIAATLYYTTYTASTFSFEQSTVLPLSTASTPPTSLKKSTAWHIWKTLNPSQTPLLHLRIEVPSIVTFRSDTEVNPVKYGKLSRPRFSMRTLRLVLWLLKIMVFPITATTTFLWAFLLYLLKNAELLEAQRNRAEPDLPDLQEESKISEANVSFSTLPRAFTSDVELIAASQDGNVVISVGLHNEVTVWRVKERAQISIDTSNALLRTASTSSVVSTLTSVAIDHGGRYCAVGTSTGTIAVWPLEGNDVYPFPLLSLDNSSAAVSEIKFTSITSLATPRPDADLILLATYYGGTAAKWSVGKGSVSYFSPSRRASTVKCSLVCIDPLDRFLVAFSMNDGTLELIGTDDVDPWIKPNFCVQAGDPLSIPSKVHACEAYLGGSNRRIIAIATQTGMVSLWDGTTAECISVFDDVYGSIDCLRVTSVKCETCHFCGQLPLESISVAFSVEHVIRPFRLYLNDQTRRCSCSPSPLRHVASRDVLGRRSRSNSASQSGSPLVSPSIPRARLATTFEVSAFPVSAHGVHSRRASEKELGRRSSEMLAVPFPGEESDSDSRSYLSSARSFWHNAVLVRLTDIACERGGWGVNGKELIGVRRKPRAQAGSTATKINLRSSQGLTVATLERWELWTFDPSVSRVQSSLLATLTSKGEVDHTSSSSRPSTEYIPCLPFTRVSSLHIASTHAFAGFGNTIGIFTLS